MADPLLPYGRQTIEADDIAAVAEALASDFLTTGPRVEAFERAFAAKVGAPHAVCCSNGTAALHLSMLALGIGPQDVCIVPSVTFLATANCVGFVGARVVFSDVDPRTGLMGPEHLAEALDRLGGGRLRAVIPVHLRGEVADLAGLQVLAAEAGAVLVEDAAHALGSQARFQSSPELVGSCTRSALTTFSFHPVKTIATGEGGMVTTRDPALAERVARFRSHGMIRPAGAAPWVYEMPEPGFNYRLPDILCALGLSQLAKLDRFAERRQQLCALYRQGLEAFAPYVESAAIPAWSQSAPHLMSVLIDFDALGRSRAEVVRTLAAGGVNTQVHYIPVHTQPYYQGLGQPQLPGADAWYRRCLSLPLYPAMRDVDVERVLDALAEALGIRR